MLCTATYLSAKCLVFSDIVICMMMYDLYDAHSAARHKHRAAAALGATYPAPSDSHSVSSGQGSAHCLPHRTLIGH